MRPDPKPPEAHALNDRSARPLGAHNPRVARLRQLVQRRATRREEGAFVVEGPILIGEALDAGVAPEAVFISDDLAAGVHAVGADTAAVEAARAVLARVIAAGITVWELPARVLVKALDVVTPRPIAAIVPISRPARDPLDADVVLVLAGVADPGNAGTLLRVAEASGVGAVVFGGDAVDAYNPKCVRASAGAVFRVPIVDREPLSAVLDRLGGSGHAVIATRADATTAYDSLDYTGPVAFLLGNEAHGLDNHLDLQVTDTVSIPMAGRTESLNVAMTGAVLCFEAARQRRAGLAAGH